MKRTLLLLILLSSNAYAECPAEGCYDGTARDYRSGSSYDTYNSSYDNGQAAIDAAHQEDANRLADQRAEQRWIDSTSPAERMPEYSYAVQ